MAIKCFHYVENKEMVSFAIVLMAINNFIDFNQSLVDKISFNWTVISSQVYLSIALWHNTCQVAQVMLRPSLFRATSQDSLQMFPTS